MASHDQMDFTPLTLRNRGVPVKLAVLGDDGKPTFDDVGEPILEEVYLQFDMAIMADVEAKFGSTAAFMATLDEVPYQTIQAIMAILLECDERTASRRILVQELPTVTAAIMVALALSQGLDPTKAAEAYPEAAANLRKAMDALTEQISTVIDTALTDSSALSSASESAEPSSTPPTSETSSEEESDPPLVAV